MNHNSLIHSFILKVLNEFLLHKSTAVDAMGKQMTPAPKSLSGHLGYFTAHESGTHGEPSPRLVLGALQRMRPMPALMEVLSQWRRPAGMWVTTPQAMCTAFKVSTASGKGATNPEGEPLGELSRVPKHDWELSKKLREDGEEYSRSRKWQMQRYEVKH